MILKEKNGLHWSVAMVMFYGTAELVVSKWAKHVVCIDHDLNRRADRREHPYDVHDCFSMFSLPAVSRARVPPTQSSCGRTRPAPPPLQNS